jgi:hypothetical protein
MDCLAMMILLLQIKLVMRQLPTTTVTAPREVPYVPSSNTTSLVDEARRQMRQRRYNFNMLCLEIIFLKMFMAKAIMENL